MHILHTLNEEHLPNVDRIILLKWPHHYRANTAFPTDLLITYEIISLKQLCVTL